MLKFDLKKKTTQQLVTVETTGTPFKGQKGNVVFNTTVEDQSVVAVLSNSKMGNSPSVEELFNSMPDNMNWAYSLTMVRPNRTWIITHFSKKEKRWSDIRNLPAREVTSLEVRNDDKSVYFKVHSRSQSFFYQIYQEGGSLNNPTMMERILLNDSPLKFHRWWQESKEKDRKIWKRQLFEAFQNQFSLHWETDDYPLAWIYKSGAEQLTLEQELKDVSEEE